MNYSMTYLPLYEHFKKNLTKDQNGFERKRSVMSNMLQFLRKFYSALDNDSKSDIVVFYDFLKAFDKVPHKLLFIKLRHRRRRMPSPNSI